MAKAKKKKSGGSKKIGQIARKAKKIRKPGEKWPTAMKRAAKELK